LIFSQARIAGDHIGQGIPVQEDNAGYRKSQYCQDNVSETVAALFVWNSGHGVLYKTSACI
jgi:hypothetical protein